MCFFLRFGKYIAVPVLTWLELESFVRFEIGLGKSRSVVTSWCSEFSDLLGTSFFSSVQKIKLSRNLILWQQKFPHWHNVEVVVCPSFIETIDTAFDYAFSIFNWIFGTKPDACSEAVIRASLKSVKTLRIEHDAKFISVLLGMCPLVETLTLSRYYIDESSLCDCKLLRSVTFGYRITVVLLKSLCQMPHLIEIHLLASCNVNHATIVFANPNLTALTIYDETINNHYVEAPITNCKLTSLTCNMFRTHSFPQFVTNHSASLTKLDLEKQVALPGVSLVALAHCHLLTDLTLPSIRYPTNTVFVQIVAGLPKLTALYASQFGSLNNESVERLAKSCPDIIRLALPDAVIAITQFSSLQKLVLFSDPDRLVSAILEKCVQLQHFELVNYLGSEIRMLENCADLEVLRLSNWLGGANVDIHLLELCLSLVDLKDVTIRTPLDGNILVSLLKNCLKLEACELIAHVMLTADQLWNLIDLFVRLRRLRFTTDSNLWDKTMVCSIAKKCRRMEEFNLDLRGPRYLLPVNIPELEEINPDLKVKIDYLPLIT